MLLAQDEQWETLGQALLGQGLYAEADGAIRTALGQPHSPGTSSASCQSRISPAALPVRCPQQSRTTLLVFHKPGALAASRDRYNLAPIPGQQDTLQSYGSRA